MMQIKYIDRPIPPIWLIQPHYTLGRSSACDIQINDDSLLTIHAHLRFDSKSNTLILVQESTGEMTVNNKPMFGQVQLNHGDTFTLGSYSLMVVDTTRQTEAVGDGWIIFNDDPELEENHFTILAPVIIGRSSKCDIHIHKGTQLSRRHARLSVINAELIVEDLGSSNGTFVNGQRIEKAHLTHDDEVRFANIAFKVRDPFFDEEEEKTAFINLSDLNALKAVPPTPVQSGPTAIEKQLKASQQKNATHKEDKAPSPAQAPAAPPRRWPLVLLGLVLGGLYLWLFR